jgi:hypothetical protein
MSARILLDGDYELPMDGGFWLGVGNTASFRIRQEGDVVSVQAFKVGREADEPYDTATFVIPEVDDQCPAPPTEDDIKEAIYAFKELIGDADLGDVDLEPEEKIKLERARTALEKVERLLP